MVIHFDTSSSLSSLWWKLKAKPCSTRSVTSAWNILQTCRGWIGSFITGGGAAGQWRRRYQRSRARRNSANSSEGTYWHIFRGSRGYSRDCTLSRENLWWNTIFKSPKGFALATWFLVRSYHGSNAIGWCSSARNNLNCRVIQRYAWLLTRWFAFLQQDDIEEDSDITEDEGGDESMYRSTLGRVRSLFSARRRSMSTSEPVAEKEVEIEETSHEFVGEERR